MRRKTFKLALRYEKCECNSILWRLMSNIDSCFYLLSSCHPEEMFHSKFKPLTMTYPTLIIYSPYNQVNAKTQVSSAEQSSMLMNVILLTP